MKVGCWHGINMQQVLESTLIISTGLIIAAAAIMGSTDYEDHPSWLSNLVCVSFIAGSIVWITVLLTPILIILYSIIPN